MAAKAAASKFKLEVPLDASGIKNFKPGNPVKVVAYDRAGKASVADLVDLDANGHGLATLGFEEHPGTVRVILGPGNASDEELKGLQTLSTSVASRQWKDSNTLRISPIAIPEFYWLWWPRWCEEYSITGRLLCADGSPVPGATVCAYDVNWWWWWISEEQQGCSALTDANGAFTITFRRCCGWLWWYWWAERNWRVDPILADRIMPVLQKIPGLRGIPGPDPAPDLQVFEYLLSDGSPQPNRLALARGRSQQGPNGSSINPGALESLRARLLAKLPPSQELERLCVWPWCPWWPWWNCDANIVFRATQNCNGKVSAILNDTILQTRFDIPNALSVTLIANDQACCLAQPCQDLNCPDGACTLPFDICSDPSSNVGGNPGASAAAATIGYDYPGLAAPGNPNGDRPYADGITISGILGTGANVDYYEFEYATSPLGPWNAMPASADGGFNRMYWTAALTPVSVPFSPIAILASGTPHNVYESRQHYEANNSIGIGWDALNLDELMVWETFNNGFSNSTYYLRLKGWTRVGYAGDLTNPQILPFCDNVKDNYMVLTLDNRPTPGPGAGHPTDHPCGLGTVHVCTTEPDCNIISVTINGQAVGPCGNIQASDDQTVVIDFMVNDPDAHLAYYTLSCNYGLNLTIPLVYLDTNPLDTGAIGPLTPGLPASFQTSWIGPAAQVGPDYGRALGAPQNATAPKWSGGTIRLTTTVGAIFPETCCYQLQLWAYKRTIVGCYYGFDGHANVTDLSFTVFKS